METNGKNRILIVDDDASWRVMLGLALKRAGYEVATAADGLAALDWLQGHECDTLISDALMFPMDGFELVRRAKDLRPELRILMLSAVASRKDASGHPIDLFLPKPVDLDPILAFVGHP